MTGSDQPHVLVVGAGSIGARHARNLAAAGARVTITDPDPDRAAQIATEVAGAVLPFDLDRLDGAGAIDGAVVASPTSYHRDQAEALLSSVPKILVEKPLALDAAGAAPLVVHADRVAVAFNLRFHEPIRRLIGLVAGGEVGEVSQVRLWFGSWLPDWRTTDYRVGYSAQARLGGGVLLDVIHELDLLRWLAGDPHAEALRVVGASVARRGPLEIDVEDTVNALVELPGGVVGTIELDYLARRYRRGIEVTGSKATVRLDWARQVLEVEDSASVRPTDAATPVDASYERQDSAFLAWIGGGAPMPVDARLGAAANALADEIRTCAARSTP